MQVDFHPRAEAMRAWLSGVPSLEDEGCVGRVGVRKARTMASAVYAGAHGGENKGE